MGALPNTPREKIAHALRERRLELLRQWGYTDTDGDPPDSAALSRAEASAEAASSLDRVVPLLSMSHRRFREEVVKPLLAVSTAGSVVGPSGGRKAKGKRRKGGKGGKGVKPSGGELLPVVPVDGESGGVSLPKSRLGRAVKAFIESADEDNMDERIQMARELNEMLGVVGVTVDHVLRKRLERFAPTG